MLVRPCARVSAPWAFFGSFCLLSPFLLCKSRGEGYRSAPKPNVRLHTSVCPWAVEHTRTACASYRRRNVSTLAQVSAWEHLTTDTPLQ